jgi:pimeloyl-ACP methyl ester carboxylesterase
VRASWNTAAAASATARLACVPTWHEDFRHDVGRIDVPTLVIHGDTDRIVPLEVAGQRSAKLITGARLVVVKGGPHCITSTSQPVRLSNGLAGRCNRDSRAHVYRQLYSAIRIGAAVVDLT